MLLAVEGGGFFSSSASGYSKGLTLLLLGQKNEDKPMRVSPWNQYQLVDQESDPDLQLASTKNCLASRCASFACFRRASAGHDTPSPLKVGPAQQQDNLPGPLVSVSGKDPSVLLDDDNNKRKVALKSSLKKRPVNFPVAVEVSHEHEPSGGKENNSPGQMERRKVQWTDACGSEIAEIREFEPSDVNGSDDEFDNGNERSCSCAIM
ncbi:Low affinity potassium transport system protein [Quillaja saponaria]|nr:Low affinity potassium transport system protein [Quillaja saponaria]